MFEPRISELNINEILKYLGFRGQELTIDIEEQINRCADEIVRASKPRLIYRYLKVVNSVAEGLAVAGKDIPKMLEECDEAIVFGATLGAGVERILMRNEVTNVADAVIMDACASTVIENICNNFESDIRAELSVKGRYLTDRFSPGYGDLPLAEQVKFFAVLDMTRKIGVSLTQTLIMIPRKSVTAIMGISVKEQEHRMPDCEHCMMFRNCLFRKAGRRCRDGVKLVN